MQFTIETMLIVNTVHTNRDWCRTVVADNDTTLSVEGPRIYPIGEMIPVIVRGEGCVGMAQIKEFTVQESVTNVTFILHECDKTTAQVLYNQYRNKVSMSNYKDASFESADDAIIPGIAPKSTRGKAAHRRYVSDGDDNRPRPSGDYHW